MRNLLNRSTIEAQLLFQIDRIFFGGGVVYDIVSYKRRRTLKLPSLAPRARFYLVTARYLNASIFS